jgi:DNA-binding response OmpR family regulator
VHGRILIVDDEDDIATVMSMGLKSRGFEVAAFVDPVKALIEYKPNLYDLAILDYKMPGLDGIALYRKIRRMDCKVKICFLSAAEEIRDLASEMPDAGACIMKKPLAIADLVHRINAVLRGARAA